MIRYRLRPEDLDVRDFPKKYAPVASVSKSVVDRKLVKLANPFYNTGAQVLHLPGTPHSDKDFDDWVDLFNLSMREAERAIWNYALRKAWLESKLAYHVIYRLQYMSTSSPFATLIKNGIARQYLYRTPKGMEKNAFSLLKSYFSDIIDPDYFLRTEDVLSDPQSDLPFPELSLAHMTLVKNLDERIGLLHRANEAKMRLPEFTDYVINWVSCLNDESAEQKYVISRMPRTKSYSIRKLSDPIGRRQLDKALYGIGEELDEEREGNE
jgi:hypothetical protein